ncbi:Nse4 C-terminal-domain-containing protein [Dichomitus squalens]|uniref:Non-structural maintenance of chromosomes element 4 n=1 Tax=Dichomitus squalens TaxID=114155 RepID=A0A4Q9MPH7_9APHY|nr:Nse4 C-terminal-domain-containing protein [Dichomitus squalens]
MARDDVDMQDVAYDPDQDPEATRDIRRKYRRAVQQLTETQDISTDEVADQLRQADLLFKEVQGIQEATNDSNLLVQISQIGAAKARAMKSGSGAFDTDDFVARLITYMGGRKPTSSVDLDDDDDEYGEAYDGAGGAPLDWERIGRRALAKSRRVPAMDFMLGPLSIEQKKRTAAKRAKLEKNKEDLKKPQEITEDDITRSGNETTKNVAALEHILNKIEGTVNIFKFVINPHDFGQSVENLFYLSFLIRDGKCAFFTDEDTGEPVILLCEQPTQKDYQEGLVKHQLVMEFDMSTWKRAIEVFNITEPMIPQRPKSEMRIGQKWYG